MPPRIGPGALITTLAAFLSLTGCAPRSEAPAAAGPPQVLVAPVGQRDEAVTQEWVGSLDGFVNAEIRPQVTGYLLKQDYVDGAPVKKGQLLFEVDPRTFQAAYDQVRASFDKSEMDLKRQAELYRTAATAREDYDNAVQANLAAKAALDKARLDLDFTRVTSPIDGVAGIAAAQIGNLVGPGGAALTTVSTLDPIKVYFSINEQSYLDFRRQQPGQPKFPEGLELRLILSDGQAYPLPGKVYAADRQVEANTGTLRMVGLFPNPDGLLRPGQYGRVRAVVRNLKGALLVPQKAVSELQGGYQVATVDAQNRVHLRPVQMGDRVGADWIVLQGLSPDDRVVVEGLQKVREGTVVDPQPAAGR